MNLITEDNINKLIMLNNQKTSIDNEIDKISKSLNYKELLKAGLKIPAIISYRKDNPHHSLSEARQDIEQHIAVNIIDYPLFKTKIIVYQ